MEIGILKSISHPIWAAVYAPALLEIIFYDRVRTHRRKDGEFEFVSRAAGGIWSLTVVMAGNPSSKNQIAIIDINLEGSLADNQFVEHVSPCDLISGTVSDDANNQDTGNLYLDGVIIVLRDAKKAMMLSLLPLPQTAWDSMITPNFTVSTRLSILTAF